MAGIAYRLWRYISEEKSAGREPFMDVFSKSKATPNQGVPLGGMGAGSITRYITYLCQQSVYQQPPRGWTGDFLTYQMKPGKPHYEPILANQFSVWIKRGEGTPTIYATLMSDNFAANPVAVVLNPREAPKDRYLQVANS